MKLPSSYKDISIEKYQEVFPTIQKILEESDEDLKHAYQKDLCRALGYPIDHLNIGDQAKAVKRISFLKSNEYKLVHKHLWINGVLYRADNSADKLITAQYVAIKTFVQDGGVVAGLHNIAPVCYKRFKWRHKTKEGTKWFSFVYDSSNHEELSEWFKKAPCDKVLPLVFFCLGVFKHWMESTEAYLNSQRIIKEREEEINRLLLDEDFLNTGLGMLQSMK